MTREELEAAMGREVVVSLPAPTQADPTRRVDQAARVKSIRGNGVDLVVVRQGRSLRVPFDWCREAPPMA